MYGAPHIFVGYRPRAWEGQVPLRVHGVPHLLPGAVEGSAFAHFGVVGDWKKVLPAFTEKVRELVEG